VRQEDVLLAVLHGHGATGWRNPEARQSYLVRNAVGDRLEPRSMEQAADALAGTGVARLRGDVIVEAIGGRPGFLYWTGAKYAWASGPRRGGAMSAIRRPSCPLSGA
jgi:hypothetical protein